MVLVLASPLASTDASLEPPSSPQAASAIGNASTVGRSRITMVV
jgi:hypothetical protein